MGTTSEVGGDPGASSSGVDFRGERRLSTRETVVWYLIAAVTYIAIGTWEKVLLTWFIGPMWLVGTVTFGPRAYDAVRARLGARSAKGGDQR